MLKLYNTLSKEKEPFTPLNIQQIGMYVCGPTVYDDIHIGNARPIVVFDLLFRLLQYYYPKVRYIRNITDVDDKIIQKSLILKKSIIDVSNLYIASFHEDIQQLNVLPPSFEPKATNYIENMINMIAILIKKNHAYINMNHVFFAVNNYLDYGKLSAMPPEALHAGVRINLSPLKKDSADFILWKPSQKNEIGWESPWGYGRPGWHIECSAMAKHYLGEHFDIHGGGQDLIFPHHENERAQSICSSSNPTPMANYWLHNGHVLLEGKKMSKSLNNFITLKALLKQYSGITIRFALLSTYYRQPLNFQESTLKQADAIIHKWKDIFTDANLTPTKPCKEFLQALNDDLNTPAAIAILHSNIHNLQQLEKNSTQYKRIKAQLIAELNLLGLLPFQESTILTISNAEIENMLANRIKAKKEQNFILADKIRDELTAKGIIITDTKNGSTWKLKS